MWSDGRKYEGDYVDDKKHGFGTYVWADGRSYTGGWLDGKQHGEGTYCQADGTARKGIWQEGKRAYWLDEVSSSAKLDVPGQLRKTQTNVYNR